jgi:predicted AAA+ superfamily ATPase
VVEQIYNSKPDYLRLYYYRTHDGAETDVVLEKGNKVVACIEIKFSNAPVLSKGFYNSLQDLKCKTGFVITPASESYINGQGVQVCSLPIFLKKYLSLF